MESENMLCPKIGAHDARLLKKYNKSFKKQMCVQRFNVRNNNNNKNNNNNNAVVQVQFSDVRTRHKNNITKPSNVYEIRFT
jgi:hypothetical protein